MSDSISTLAELKAASQTPTAARNRLTYLFDEGKFTELDAYAAAGDSLAGVITAFGYVEGNPVYAFSQDVTVKDGALTEAQAKKIAKVYDLAAKTGVPVVGIFDSYGADVSDGSKALNAYGELLMWTSNLSGVVPQIADVAGTCAGCAAMLAESADFTVIAKDAELYVAPNANIKNSAENAAENGTAAVVCEDDKAAVEAAKNILTKLPQRGHIINGHVPVKIKNGESPVKADGRLFVIDGGISKAYQKATGIAGYTLIYDSHSLNLAEHKPFIAGESEHTPEIHMVERLDRRANISDTDKGRELLLQINDLRDLLDAYRSGDIKEGYKVF